MKTQISRQSFNAARRYSGVYQQQGRMLTDADWNALVDLIKHRLDDALDDVIGAGTPRRRPFQLRQAGSDLKLVPGYLYIDGIAAQLTGDTEIDYAEQPDLDTPPALPSDCVLYADVWERTVTALEDPGLMDSALHGADTCTRRQTQLQVKWSPSGNPEDFPATGDARLTVTIREGSTTPDLCDPCAAEVAVNARSGNALFRIEVHHSVGDDSDPLQSVNEVWLKWSAENGAEQYALHDAEGNDLEPPGDFIDDLRSYEFFTTETERNLGLYPKGAPLPLRGEISTGYHLPASGKPRDYVRRWDGYCVLKKTSGTWAITQGQDRTMKDFLTSPEVSLDPLTGSLRVGLEAIQFECAVEGKTLFAGDYWTVPLREREFQAELERKAANPSYVIPPLLDDAVCRGVEHHYLNLGRMTAGTLAVNPELDRRYAFPRLTELTRLFIAGGDGQTITPGEPLSEKLRVGVANGEWPVMGATVRFELLEGDGSLTPADGLVETNSEGIAECLWQPGADPEKNYRVKAVLVDPDFPVGPDHDQLPPVYFSAHLLSGDEVSYTPGCDAATENTVHHLLVRDDSLKPGEHGYYSVSEVLDALLCQLSASVIPLNRTAELCATLKDDRSVQTVQDAINVLCRMERGSGCSVTVGKGGQFQTLEDVFANADQEGIREICICLLPGEHLIRRPLEVLEKISIRITGCGAAVSRILFNIDWKMQADEIVLRDLSMTIIDSENNLTTGVGNLTLIGLRNARCIVEHCQFSRTFDGKLEQWQPMVTVDGRVQMDWRANKLRATRRDTVLQQALLLNRSALNNSVALELVDAWQQLWSININDDTDLFSAQAQQIAEQLMHYEADAREQVLAARDAMRIEVLPDNVTTLPRFTERRTRNVSMFRNVSPKVEVEALYRDIWAINTDTIAQFIERLKLLARLVTRFDEAIALTSAKTDGRLTDNVIWGDVVLFSANHGDVPLDWGPTYESSRGRKLSWAEQGGYLRSTGILDFRGNLLSSVTSMVPEQLLTRFKNYLDRGQRRPPKIVFSGYETLVMRDNILHDLDNSLIAKSLRLDGNEFRAGYGSPDIPDIVVFTMSYQEIFVGNQAISSHAVIEVTAQHIAQSANQLQVV